MLTVENVESIFGKVCGIVGDESQTTSIYLMRANSINEMANELDMTVEDIKESLFKSDVERFNNHKGAIIWADYDTEDFYLLFDDTNEAIQNFVDKVRAK